jgi:hypothetical protein
MENSVAGRLAQLNKQAYENVLRALFARNTSTPVSDPLANWLACVVLMQHTCVCNCLKPPLPAPHRRQ